MTMRLNFTLDRQVITRIDSNRVVAGAKGYVAAHFIDVRGDWTVPTTAIFGTYAVLLDDNMDCIVPWEVLADPGTFEVSAFCGDLHTANTARVDVEATGYKKGETPGDPTPDVYATLVNKVSNAEKIAKSVRDDADAGRFKGEKGERGERGERGDRGPKGEQGPKGDPFTYADFTESQIAELQRPATEAAAVADKAAKDAQAAIAEVKATEAKLYPVVENILKGKVKETFVHIDDAFAGAALREITIEGACKQDGTPSPDNFVPIEVIKNPAMKVTGRNLLNTELLSDMKNFDTSQSGKGFYVYKFTAPSRGDYTVSVRRTSSTEWYFATGVSGVFETAGLKWFAHPNVKLTTVINYKDVDTIYLFFSNSLEGVKKVIDAIGGIQIEKGLTATALEPYTSQSQSFTLPAEHPYLAKLSDGTADEITVDKDGNVELVARVGEYTVLDEPYVQLDTEECWGVLLELNAAGKIYLSEHFSITQCLYNPTSNWLSIPASYSAFSSVDELKRFMVGKKFLFSVKEPKTYPLGKIEMPKAQDNVVNVWTDAEVTPRTGIEYTRDVNIVVANLESAIASITEG